MKKMPIVLGATLLVIGIVAAVLFGEVRAQQGHNAQLAARVERLEVAHAASAGLSAMAPMAAAPAPAAGVTMTASGPPPAGASPTPDNEPNSLAVTLRQSMNTEGGRELTRTMLASVLAQQYPDLASELGLSAEQADRLLETLARQRTETGMEQVNMLGGTADRAARAEMARRLAATEQAHEAELSEMLGADYPKWKEYQRNAATRQREESARAQVARLRTAVSAGRPMDDAQFEALRSALDEEERRIQVESRGLGAAQQLQRLSQDQRRRADVAARYLDAQQLQGYQRHLQQQGDMMRMVVGALGATAGSDAPGAPTAPSEPPAD